VDLRVTNFPITGAPSTVVPLPGFARGCRERGVGSVPGVCDQL